MYNVFYINTDAEPSDAPGTQDQQATMMDQEYKLHDKQQQEEGRYTYIMHKVLICMSNEVSIQHSISCRTEPPLVVTKSACAN